jgi:pyridoxine 4-dehydrogenase
MTSVSSQPARASGECLIGGIHPVVRLGYGATHIPGPGVLGEPRDHDRFEEVR